MDRRVFLGVGAGAVAALQVAPAARAEEPAPYRLSGRFAPRHEAALRRIGLYAAEHMRVHRLPGMTMAVVGPDGLDAQLALGFSDVERGTPVAPEHLFHIGSISKSFTAVMIHQLAAEGRLSLDDRIDAHLSGLPLPSGVAITVNHLLAHSSGLPEDAAMFPQSPDGRLWVGFAPGSNWSYSNLGYTLLGKVVEEKDGRSLAESLRVRIFQPLGMSGARGALYPADRALYAVGYAPSDPDEDYRPDMALRPAPWETNTYGDGCVGANALDVARWMRWLVAAGRGVGGPLMPDAQARRFAKAQVPAPGWAIKGASYGSGLAYVPLEGRTVMQHTGGMLAFHSSMHVDPAAGVGAFASVNSGAGSYRPRDVTAFACAMARAAVAPEPGLDPMPVPATWRKPPAPTLDTRDAEPEFRALAGRYAATAGVPFGTVTILAVKGGLALPDGTQFERTPAGYWVVKPDPDHPGPLVERMWFENEVNGRPQSLVLSGVRLDRI